MQNDLFREVSGVGLDVGFLCASWPHAAAGELARELALRGHRAHVLCLAAEGAAPFATQSSVEQGVGVRRMGRPPEDDPGGEAVDRVVLAWLAETPCDIVHAHVPSGFGLGAVRAIADLGQPLVASLDERALEAGGPLAAELRTPEELARLSLAQRLFVPSPAFAERLVAAGVRAAQVTVSGASLDRAAALAVERAYVEVIREHTGIEPRLAHALEPAPARASGAPAAAPPSAARPRKNFLRRLFRR